MAPWQRHTLQHITSRGTLAYTSTPSAPENNGCSPEKRHVSIWTLPTMLTMGRLFAIPPVMWLFTFPDPAAAAWASGIFVVASLTDFLDGYLARKLDLSTPFGAFLDPVADKLMVCAVLVLLCTKTFTVGLLAVQPWLMQALAVAIISREIAMSALREWAAGLSAEARSVVAVNWLGKYKTTLQLMSLAMLVFAMNGGQGPVVEVCAAVGPWALIGAAGLTVYSFMIYFVGLAKYLL